MYLYLYLRYISKVSSPTLDLQVALVRVLRNHSLVKCELTPTRLTYHHESLFLRCKEKLLVRVEQRNGV